MLLRLGKKYPIELFSILIFLIILPLSLKIDYLQNDEVTHFQSVLGFLHGDFTLHQYIITTFYSQGSLEALWITLFGVRYMAVLTLVISVLTLYFFTKIVKQFFGASTQISILMGLLLLFNPIFLYSVFGNMTENYFLFYFVVSMYFFYSYVHRHKTSSFVWSLVFATLGFLTRQVGILISLGYGLYLMSQKKYKEGFIALLTFVLTVTWYFTIFPRTKQMIDSSGPSFVNLLDVDRAFSLVAIALSYIGVFFIPLILSLVKSVNKKHLVLFAGLVLAFTFVFFEFFKPGEVNHTSVLADGRILNQNNSSEFPYLWNVYGRTGFFPDNIGGVRYHHAGYFSLFKIYHYVGIAMSIILFAYLTFLLTTQQYKKLLTPEFFLLLVNLGIILVLSKVYDRYLLPSFPAFILLVLSLRGVDFNKLEKLVLVGFIAFFGFLGYQYSMDFVLVNKFAWQKATELVEQGIEPQKIKIGNAWGVMYPNGDREYDYHVAYEPKRGFETLETYKIDFPFSIYIDPYVYLVKKQREN